MKLSVRLIIVIATSVLVAIIVYWYWESDEGRIRKVLSGAVSSFEEEDIAQLMTYFSLRYRDEQGWAYLNLKKLCERAFDEFEGLDGKLQLRQLEIDGDRATVLVDFKLIAQMVDQKAYLLGSPKEALRWKIRAVNGLEVSFMNR